MCRRPDAILGEGPPSLASGFFLVERAGRMHDRGVDPLEIRGEPLGSPVLIEVPHAGLALEPMAAATMSSPAWAIAHDADLHVDVLFADAPLVDATFLVAPWSRHVCDLNVEPARSVLAEGDAMTFHTSAQGRRCRLDAVASAEAGRRRREIFEPYHAAIDRLMGAKRDHFGLAVLVSAHSFPPSRGGARWPDIVVGTRKGQSAGREWSDTVVDAAEREGFSVGRDEPFAGGHTVARVGRPAEGLHALQVEVRRDLYLDEATLQVRPEAFAKVQAWASRLVGSLVRASRAR